MCLNVLFALTFLCGISKITHIHAFNNHIFSKLDKILEKFREKFEKDTLPGCENLCKKVFYLFLILNYAQKMC